MENWFVTETETNWGRETLRQKKKEAERGRVMSQFIAHKLAGSAK